MADKAPTLVTTSWDDGHPLNLKLLDLLDRVGAKGTFYIAPRCHMTHSDEELREMASRQDLGGHTLNHPDLDTVSLDTARAEIADGKAALEQIVGREMVAFSYPNGRHTPEIKRLVKEGGFLGGRTCVSVDLDPVDDWFEWNTSLHMYPHPLRKRDADNYLWGRALLQPAQRNWPRIWRHRLPLSALWGWDSLARATFERVHSRGGGLWHLWGHSWELEKYGTWDRLEEFLRFVIAHDNVELLNNSDVLRRYTGQASSSGMS